jgi:putative ABC transport system permease protein
VAAIRRALLRVVAFFRSDHAEADLAREIHAHLQLLEDRFVAQGMSAEDARFAARRTFGGVEQAKEHQRDARSFRWLANSWMDVKLGWRMLVKYPGLTLVGGLGIAVGVAIAAGAFTIIYTLTDPALPVDEGDRVVVIQNWDTATKRQVRRTLHDFIAWRHELASVQDLGAFRQVSRNLIAPGGPPETVRIAEITASGFTVPRVSPLLGRPLIEDDERPGAVPVAVIGFEVWRNRFAADPHLVGRPIQLGETEYTVVGVMPEGFAFPINNGVWVALGVDPSKYQPGEGPEITVFGRLAPDATFDSAQSELTMIGQRTAAAYPATHSQVRPRILPYTYPLFGVDQPETIWIAHLGQVLITLLIVIVSVNVAILVFARTATRTAEIAIRTALGASRRRIVVQLFVEALVLSAAAAAVGLWLTSVGVREVHAAMARMRQQLPFWWTFDLSSGTVLYVIAITFLAAAIVGVGPALELTGRRAQARLQGISAGGGSGMQFGKIWTVLIVVQIAFAVALLPAAVFHAWEAVRFGLARPGFATEDFLTARLLMDMPARPNMSADAYQREFDARYAARQVELLQRLKADPAVSHVTFALDVPGNEGTTRIEAESLTGASEGKSESTDATRDPATSPARQSDLARSASVDGGSVVFRMPKTGQSVKFGRVGVGLFDALGVPVLMGRAFDMRDVGPGASTVIVNRSFVRKIFGDAPPLGRRIRHVDVRDAASGRWYEIVGVVSDFPAMTMESDSTAAGLYQAAAPGELFAVSLAIRVRGSAPATFAGRLRETAAAVDPNLQLRNVQSLEDVLREEQTMLRLVAAVLAALTLSVVLLSSSGIYAMMSFTVSARRKEIGIRAALGADPHRILRNIFARAARQLAMGAVLGMAAAEALDVATRGELMQGHGAVVLPIVALLLMLIGLLAALGPARRGMRVAPTEALREH